NVGILFVIFRLRFGRLGTREILMSLGKIAISAAEMRAVCWSALQYSLFDMIERFLPRLIVFVSLIVSATLTFLALAWLFRCNELSEVYGIAFQRDRSVAGRTGWTG